jgi:hypothetical protein
MSVVKRGWIPLVIVVLVAIAGFTVSRLHATIRSHNHAATTSDRPDAITPFNPKRVTLEVSGPAGTLAEINYLDVDAQPQRVDQATLPWSYTIITTLPAVVANVVAQGNSDTIACRIVVNGVVRDERSSNEVNAQTFCLVKSA